MISIVYFKNHVYYYITTSNEFQMYTYNQYDYHRHIASFHGEDDYRACVENKLIPNQNIIISHHHSHHYHHLKHQSHQFWSATGRGV
jgi:hypothetical protein